MPGVLQEFKCHRLKVKCCRALKVCLFVYKVVNYCRDIFVIAILLVVLLHI
jgi:hypothetical protein